MRKLKTPEAQLPLPSPVLELWVPESLADRLYLVILPLQRLPELLLVIVKKYASAA